MSEQISDPVEVIGVDQFKPTPVHRGGYANDKLANVLNWVSRHPDCTLSSGEGKLLVEEINRLTALSKETRQNEKNGPSGTDIVGSHGVHEVRQVRQEKGAPGKLEGDSHS